MNLFETMSSDYCAYSFATCWTCYRPDGGEPGRRSRPNSMHIVADAPDERFKAAAQAMRARDKLDKQRAAQLRRELRAAKKARRKAREQVRLAAACVLSMSMRTCAVLYAWCLCSRM